MSLQGISRTGAMVRAARIEADRLERRRERQLWLADGLALVGAILCAVILTVGMWSLT